ncbi:MAG: adenylate/guanylate cyclase domain-containing protein [Pseudomonadota bacterium]
MVSAQRDVQDDKNLHYLTLLAIDFICATSDFFGIDTELDVALSAEFSEICDAVLDRHGAHVTGRSPTGVLACFGYPSPSEGDARNALKAALEITEDIGSVRSRGPDHTVISARCGVHTGPVVLHHEAAMGGDFKVTGTACNAAVDLAREAKAGEVLVSVASIGRDQNKFKTAGRRQLAVAGAADPIDVLSVESIRDRSGYDGQDAAAPAASDTAPADGMTPFIGREQEIERLSDLGWQVTEGAQKSIAVVGEPGVGKTRLVREFLATSIPADAMVWQAQCDDYGSAEPLGPVLQILRQMLGLDRAMPADAIVARVTEALGSWGLPTEPHLGVSLSQSLAY